MPSWRGTPPVLPCTCTVQSGLASCTGALGRTCSQAAPWKGLVQGKNLCSLLTQSPSINMPQPHTHHTTVIQHRETFSGTLVTPSLSRKYPYGSAQHQCCQRLPVLLEGKHLPVGVGVHDHHRLGELAHLRQHQLLGDEVNSDGRLQRHTAALNPGHKKDAGRGLF